MRLFQNTNLASGTDYSESQTCILKYPNPEVKFVFWHNLIWLPKYNAGGVFRNSIYTYGTTYFKGQLSLLNYPNPKLYLKKNISFESCNPTIFQIAKSERLLLPGPPSLSLRHLQIFRKSSKYPSYFIVETILTSYTLPPLFSSTSIHYAAHLQPFHTYISLWLLPPI